jgi:Restriction endonuclease
MVGSQMATHDFSRLSSYDFEELIRDLLQADWRIRLESFKPGPDSGIDLRCLIGSRGTTIVQCKHYSQSGYQKLLRQLKKEELSKIHTLAPSRYVLATSVPLSPKNKKELTKLLRPYVKRQSDIIGKGDIENLLRLHPKIEVANFKLWLTSTAVLQRVLHNAEKCQTEFEVERVRRKLPIFVQNKAFPRAQNILNRSRIVVISGVPGIGKTTLADMLLYAHLEKGYEPVIVQGGLDEAKRVFNRASKQIFYFDDFLGQTFLRGEPDMLAKNQDAALISFMDAIRHSKNARFILTTREHILKKAISASERIAKSPILNHRCVIELSDYSFGQKARILYNHLYFSDLPISYRKAVLRDDFFLSIIRHRNFNPRIIEWLSGYVRVRQVEAGQYQAHIERILAAPEEIWQHAFEEQISDAARNVLFALYAHSFGEEVSDLEVSWQSLHQHSSVKYNFSTSPRDFRRALNDLEGSFIKIDNQIADYLNPSIRDFIENIFCHDRNRVLDVIVSATSFHQIIAFRELWEQRKTEQLAEALVPTPEVIASLKRVMNNPNVRWKTDPDGRQTGTYFDTSLERRISALVTWADETNSHQLLEVAALILNDLEQGWKGQIVSFVPVIGILRAIEKADWVMQHSGAAIRRRILDAMLADLHFANYYAWKAVLEYRRTSSMLSSDDMRSFSEALTEYRRRGVVEELAECESSTELQGLREGLVELQKENRISFKQTIKRIDREIAKRDEPQEDEDPYQSPKPSLRRDPPNEDEVRRLFSTLLD